MDDDEKKKKNENWKNRKRKERLTNNIDSFIQSDSMLLKKIILKKIYFPLVISLKRFPVFSKFSFTGEEGMSKKRN